MAHLGRQISHQNRILISKTLAKKLLAIRNKRFPLLMEEVTDNQCVQPGCHNMSPDHGRFQLDIWQRYPIKPLQFQPAKIIYGNQNNQAVRQQHQGYLKAQFQKPHVNERVDSRVLENFAVLHEESWKNPWKYRWRALSDGYWSFQQKLPRWIYSLMLSPKHAK